MSQTILKIIVAVATIMILGNLAGCPPTYTMHSPDSYLQRYSTGLWRLDRERSAELIAAAPEPPTATISIDSEGSNVVREPGHDPTPEEIAERFTAIRAVLESMDVLITLNEDHTGRFVVEHEDSRSELAFRWEAPPGFRSDNSIYPITAVSETDEAVPTLRLEMHDSGAGDQLQFRILPLRWIIVLRRE